jgi:circadian clock protein KaiC
MRSIGIDLEPWVKRGLLRFYAERPGAYGLEKHLVAIHDIATIFDPRVVVIDPITNFNMAGTYSEVKSLAIRLIDLFKSRQMTAMFTSLTAAESAAEVSEVGVSSLMDAWLLLRNLEYAGERNRGLYVLKARGMAHSKQIREFILTDKGAQLLDVYAGPEGLLTGSARVEAEARQLEQAAERTRLVTSKGLELKQKQEQLELEIARMRSAFEREERALMRDAHDLELRKKSCDSIRAAVQAARQADRLPMQSNGSHATSVAARN